MTKTNTLSMLYVSKLLMTNLFASFLIFVQSCVCVSISAYVNTLQHHHHLLRISKKKITFFCSKVTKKPEKPLSLSHGLSFFPNFKTKTIKSCYLLALLTKTFSENILALPIWLKFKPFFTKTDGFETLGY